MGEIKTADGIGTVGNPTCGDVMKLYLKIELNKQKKYYIKDVKSKEFPNSNEQY